MNVGDMALRTLMTNLASEDDLTDYSLGYARGQLSTINIWMEPDAEVFAEAKRAVDEFSKRVQH